MATTMSLMMPRCACTRGSGRSGAASIIGETVAQRTPLTGMNQTQQDKQGPLDVVIMAAGKGTRM